MSCYKFFVFITLIALAACHSMEGEALYGPPLDNIRRMRIVVIREGEVVNLITNRRYLARSVEEPGYEKVTGYESRTMPETYLTCKDRELIVDFIIESKKRKEDQ